MNKKYHKVTVILACVAVLATVLMMGFGPSSVIGLSSATPTPSHTQNGTAVVFHNQTTNGSTVTIEQVVLPAGGFVAIHTSEYIGGPAPADLSIIAVSKYLPAGTHHNVTIDISHAPANNPPGLNQTKLDYSQTVRAVVYKDEDEDHQFDFVRTYGSQDTAFEHANGSVVVDSAGVRVPEPKPKTASVIFESQTLQNDPLIVKQARLPNGGFLVALNASYQQTDDPLTSVVGLSQYLPPGNYTNVSIQVLSGALDRTQTVTVIPARDTNDNQRYDYVRSGGFDDVAYETLNHSTIVTDTAKVHVPGSQQTRTIPIRTQTRTATQPTETPADSQSENTSNGLFDFLSPGLIIGVLVVLVVLYYLWRRVS